MQRTFPGLIIWFIATLFVIYGFCLNSAAAAFSDEIKQSLHTNEVGISIAIGSFITGFALMQIPAGYLLDRYSTHVWVSGAVFLTVMGNILISISDTLLLFSVANFLQGIGSSFAFIAVGLLIDEWFSAAMFPILMGLIETVSTLVAGFTHYFYVVIFETSSWVLAYKYLAVMGAILFLLTLIFVKSPPNSPKGKALSFSKSLMQITEKKQIWLCMLAAATSFGVLLAYADFWYVRVQKFYLVEHKETALIGGLFYLGIAIGTPLLGWVSNIVNSRKMILHVSLILGNMTLLLALYLPHFNMETLIVVKIISFLTGFFLSGSMLFYTIVKETTPDSLRGVALGLANTGVFLFNSFMLLIPYLFITTFSKEFFTYLWVLPFFVMISILINYFVRDGLST